MNDRELLELAAKADGRTPSLDRGYAFGVWNPLTDDGDALRLAVKLGVTVYPPEDEHDDATASYQPDGWINEPQGSDPYAATRRAIVRAAAEIGGQK